MCGLIFGGCNYEREYEQRQKLRRDEQFAMVREGRSDALIYDVELLVRLARDDQCVAKVEMITFTFVDLADERFEQTRKLKNVREIGFYDCHGADQFLESIQGMSSIESFFFEATGFSDLALQSLASFPSLKEVHFEGLMTQREIDLLRSIIPNVRIKVTDGGHPTAPATEPDIQVDD